MYFPPILTPHSPGGVCGRSGPERWVAADNALRDPGYAGVRGRARHGIATGRLDPPPPAPRRGAELVGIVYAGYAAPKLAETLDLEEVRRGIEMSALGAVRTAEAFTPLLKKYKGRFIMVADMAGQIVIPSLQSYCMSQAVTLQFVKIIRNNLKKHGVSTHIIQPFLYYYQKTQEDYYYPYTTEDGKVVVESNVDGTDFTAFRIMMSIFDALMSKNPKEYFTPTYPELLLHTLINFFPPCLYNRLADHLFMNLTKQKEMHDNRKDKSALLSASTVK
ncbi:Short-chain dehydrogenase/reductase family 9C member 7 [Gryllus bimaculatus]|nr:Short-chain dehydrogenase/reductase family 9C member 7 [Gryllus bimaculatus]